MSESEEKRPKSKVSRLVSPKTLGGKEILTAISGDPWDLISEYVGKDVNSTNFSGKNLRGAKYKDYKFVDTIFDDSDLTDASFVECIFHKCSFKNAIMDRINLDNSRMKQCSFVNAKLTNSKIRNVIMSGSNLVGTVFDESDLSSSVLDESIISKTSFKGATLKSTQLKDLQQDGKSSFDISFEKANLTAANIKFDGDVVITDAILTGCRLSDVSINKQILKDIDFSGSGLENVKFIDSELIGVNFASATFSNTNFTKSDLIDVNFINTEIEILFDRSKVNGCFFGHIKYGIFTIKDSIIWNCGIDSPRDRINNSVKITLNFDNSVSKIGNCAFSNTAMEIINSVAESKLVDCKFVRVEVIGEVTNITMKKCIFDKTTLNNLNRCEIDRCDFQKGDFGGLEIKDCSLTGNYFTECSMGDGNITHTTFEDNNFTIFSVSRIKIHDSILRKNTFDGATFDRVSLDTTNFMENTCNDIEFGKSDVVGSRMINNSFEGVIFSSIRGDRSNFNNKYLGSVVHTGESSFDGCALGREDNKVFETAVFKNIVEKDFDRSKKKKKEVIIHKKS